MKKTIVLLLAFVFIFAGCKKQEEVIIDRSQDVKAREILQNPQAYATKDELFDVYAAAFAFESGVTFGDVLNDEFYKDLSWETTLEGENTYVKFSGISNNSRQEYTFLIQGENAPILVSADITEGFVDKDKLTGTIKTVTVDDEFVDYYISSKICIQNKDKLFDALYPRTDAAKEFINSHLGYWLVMEDGKYTGEFASFEEDGYAVLGLLESESSSWYVQDASDGKLKAVIPANYNYDDFRTRTERTFEYSDLEDKKIMLNGREHVYVADNYDDAATIWFNRNYNN